MRVTYELEQDDLPLLLELVRDAINVATVQATDDEAGLLATHRLTRLTTLRRRLDAPVHLVWGFGGAAGGGGVSAFGGTAVGGGGGAGGGKGIGGTGGAGNNQYPNNGIVYSATFNPDTHSGYDKFKGAAGGGAAKPSDTGAGGVFVPRVDNGCGTEVGQGASAPLPNCVEGSQLCPQCGKWLK